MAYYLADEREVQLNFDPVDKFWSAWTNMPNWRDKLLRCGWTLTKTSKVSGMEVDWSFKIHEMKPVTIRNMNKVKHIKNNAENATSDDETDSDDTFIVEE